MSSYYSPNNINDDEDIVIKVDEKSMSSNSGYELPPIITKKTKQVVVGVRKSFSNNSNSNSNTTGKKLKLRRRSNSSSSSSSFAVVKYSYDPHRDFKESMLEMIVHNNIRASKDLEDLLACYLSLNSHQYHHLSE
ncbi:hypothetical protein ACFE04_002103 [Oxalis oulophora]